MAKHYRKALVSSAALAAGVFLAQGAVHADQVTLKSGDTLSALAIKYGTTANALAQHNNIADANKVYAGQTIDTDTNANTTTPTTVVVKAGDTLSSIANTYKTTVQQIKQDNGLTSDMIYVGQQLKINPAGTPSQAPAQQQTTQQTQQPAQQAAPQQQQQTTQQQAPAQQQSNNSGYQMRTYQPAATTQQRSAAASNYTSDVAGNDAAAKAWIAGRESGGNYNARNGQYIGKYQLSSSYLGGDYSPANQERVADNYVAQRYGSWSNAQRFWQANGWY